MDEMSVIGQVIGGKFGDIIIRQKAGNNLEIGGLLVSEEQGSFLIMQVFALEYASQMDDRMQQMISGVNLEEDMPAQRFYEPGFVNYLLARIKPLARVFDDGNVRIPKSLPSFFNKLRIIAKDDLRFMQKGEDQIFVGNIRSGSTVLREAEVWLDAEEVFSHHVLIPATTGRGKSNLVKTILWHALYSNKIGIMILDAHDEYFGRHGPGLRNHPNARRNLTYYTPSDPPVGAKRLSINLESIRPEHFEGIADFSDAQFQAIQTYHNSSGRKWIHTLMTADPYASKGSPSDTAAVTMSVLQRKMRIILGLTTDEDGNLVSRHEVFDSAHGMSTVNDIVNDVESGRVVILDTSRLGSDAELIVGNIVASRIMEKYKQYKAEGILGQKPVASVIIEEAPRVIGEDVLTSKNDNIYATIAKEGRKFKVGLVAITQLSSVIPKTILANMNTKIILGNEMRQEREAIIASASQDLSDDDKNIASLDKGEAIISSIFVPFATPIKIPLFEDLVRDSQNTSPGPAANVKVF